MNQKIMPQHTSIDLPRSIGQPFSNTPGFVLQEFSPELTSYIHNSHHDLSTLAAISVALLMSRYTMQTSLSIRVQNESAQDYIYAIETDETTTIADMAAMYQSAFTCEGMFDEFDVAVKVLPELSRISDDVGLLNSQLESRLIDFCFMRSADKLVLKVVYNRHYIKEWCVRQLVSSLFNMLEDICSEKDLQVKQVSLVSVLDLVRMKPQAEHDSQLYYFPIGNMFEQTVSNNKDAIAIKVHGQDEMTYGDLNCKAAKLAHLLVDRVDNVNDRVAIVAPSSCEFVVALLACLKANLTFVPIDVSLPMGDIKSMVDGATLVLTINEQMEKLSSLSLPLIDVTDAAVVEGYSVESLDLYAQKDKSAAVYFSKSKLCAAAGADVPHTVVFNYLAFMSQKYSLSARDVAMPILPIHDVMSLYEWLHPLLNGSTVITGNSLVKAGCMVERILLHKVTHLHLTPIILRSLLDDTDFADCHTLRTICSSGDLLTCNDVRRFRMISKASIYNIYCLAEVGAGVACSDCGSLQSGINASVGRVNGSFRVMILDEQHRVVPVGALGEVYLQNDHMLSVSARNTQSMRSQFVELELFGEKSIWLKTNDIGRWLPNRELCLIGHRERQVRISGCRIELQEIASKLLSFKHIKKTLVMPYNHPDGTTKLAAFVIMRYGNMSDELSAELHDFIKSCLPKSMRPDQIVEMDDFIYCDKGLVDSVAMMQVLNERKFLRGT